ncbi:MAG: dTDP-4-dehydrorhamnose reductase [Patescibacteria group bacterium]|jgi:dTDP-4-dehydrorhamnose reductase|nr:dTDP-4-dehydrorhamnose reductase [Patescibacteria group bacterium]
MEQKVLILGANGMLGHDLSRVFANQNPFLWDQTDLDITDQIAVEKKLADLHPTVIINAAAYTNVDGAETDAQAAFKINADAVGYLAQTAQTLGAILVHFSTEYVFDGKNKTGYREDSQIGPLNVYGHSKVSGEELLIKNCEMYYLIRSSWLYGHSPQIGKPRGLNFVETMLKLAAEGRPLKVVNDQFGSPTYTVDLALQTRNIIEQFKPCGIYHVTNSGVCSWYDFAAEVFKLKGLAVDLQPIKSQDYPLATSRPQYSILLNTKLDPLRSWNDALKDYLQ